MAFDVIILHSATIEVAAILEWYSENNAILIDEFYNAWLAAVEKLKVNPQFYFNIHQDYRRILLEGFSYKIIYEIDGNCVIIQRVSHTSRADNWPK